MKPFVIYNWKTYVSSVSEAVALADALSDSENSTPVVCPSALHIPTVASVLSNKRVALGAQDISASADHPQTGSLSGAQISDAGASYVLVGHAETRAIGITNEMVAEKTVHALACELTPVVCLSEQEAAARQPGLEVSDQLKYILSEVSDTLTKKKSDSPSFIVAYEPTAYIGADSALDSETIGSVTSLLRGVLHSYNLSEAPVIYGGSVAVENVKGILQSANTDGFLIGRAGVHAGTANMILSSL